MTDWLKVYEVSVKAFAAASEALAEHRRIAQENGVPDSELDKADARHMKHYDIKGPDPSMSVSFAPPTPHYGQPTFQGPISDAYLISLGYTPDHDTVYHHWQVASQWLVYREDEPVIDSNFRVDHVIRG